MKQSVLKGEDIFINISQSLKNSTKSIIVVSAWFTDQELLDILLTKQKEGIKVSVVIGDNKDNEKLNFKELISSGGNFTKIKGKGYGMMHQKYCVIDEKECYHGSYNWTVNARKNNSESVIKTDHNSTIQDLLNDFNKLTMKEEETEENTELETKKSFLNKLLSKVSLQKEKPNTQNDNDNIEIDRNDISIDEVFKSIISAEAKKTDVDSLKKKGFDLSKEVSGDHNVLTKAMDSLYHLYIADNAENVKLKEKLTQKIEKKKDGLIQLEEMDRVKKTASDELFELTMQKEYTFERSNFTKEIELNNKEIDVFKKTIENVKEKISNVKEKITSLELDFMKPAFNWFAFTPYSIFIIGLGTYLMFFYSSSLYIMIYSFQDSMALIKEGITLEDINPQVFESSAISEAFKKKGVAGYFIILFFFVPLVIAYVSHLKDELTENRSVKDYIRMISSYLVVFAIDAFIAAKVTNTIIEIKKEAKQLDPNFELTLYELITDLNFWMVFCLGALPFIFLSILIEKLSIFFKERSPETEKKKLKHQKKVLERTNKEHLSEIENLENRIKEKELEVISIKNELNQTESKATFLPMEVNNRKEKNDGIIDKRIEYIKNKASLFLNDIDNDNIKISFSTLKHRISAFVEGWNEWLHETYSIKSATIMSDDAVKTIDSWLEENQK